VATLNGHYFSRKFPEKNWQKLNFRPFDLRGVPKVLILSLTVCQIRLDTILHQTTLNVTSRKYIYSAATLQNSRASPFDFRFLLTKNGIILHLNMEFKTLIFSVGHVIQKRGDLSLVFLILTATFTYRKWFEFRLIWFPRQIDGGAKEKERGELNQHSARKREKRI
jgi:hypothetical protein